MSFSRRYPRISDTEDLLAQMACAGRPFAARVMDLSEGGMLVEGNGLAVGERIPFELAGPDLRSGGTAEVAHCAGGSAGLRFVQMDGSGKREICDLVATRVLRERLVRQAGPIPGQYLG